MAIDPQLLDYYRQLSERYAGQPEPAGAAGRRARFAEIAASSVVPDPEGIKSYKAGTVVLQPANGKLYECKPFPYSGWCQINSHHYVPGVGSDWSDAWIAK